MSCSLQDQFCINFPTLNFADLHNREHVLMKTVLVINLEVKDNHEEAAVGGRLTLELCQEVCFLFRKVSVHWLIIDLMYIKGSSALLLILSISYS